MAQGPAQPPPDKARIVEEVGDAPITDSIQSLTMDKDLQLRIKSDNALRSSIDALIYEMKEIKDLIRLSFKV
jgi:hypothetical protein